MLAVSCELKGETLYGEFFPSAAEPCAALRGAGSVPERADCSCRGGKDTGAPLPVPTSSTSTLCCCDECSGLRFIFLASTSGLTLHE